jgi:hypothetical protein
MSSSLSKCQCFFFLLSPFDRTNKRIVDVMYAYICPRLFRRFLIIIRARIGMYNARSINKTLIFFWDGDEYNVFLFFTSLLLFSREWPVDKETERLTIKISITKTGDSIESGSITAHKKCPRIQIPTKINIHLEVL